MTTPALVPFGIRLDGRPVIPPLTTLELGNIARRDEETPLPGATLAARRLVDNILDWLKANRLGDYGYDDRAARVDPAAPGVGWGVVYHRSISAEIRAEMDRLVEHRQGYLLEDWAARDTLLSWLEKHGVDALNRDVTSKLPYYILIVARPDQVSFQDQFELNRMRAVGRLDLGNDPTAYRAYIDGIFASQSRSCRGRRVLLADACPAANSGVQFGASGLVSALAEKIVRQPVPGVEITLREAATCAGLRASLHPGKDGCPPALAFVAAPGVWFPINHRQQQAEQGAWIGADWQGGPLPRQAYLAAEDAGPDFTAPGSILFSLASYGVGTPQKSEFARVYNLAHPAVKLEEDLARHSFSAALPGRLLSLEVEGVAAGALAFAGFSDLSWISSFWDPIQGQPALDLYQTFLHRLLQGETIGMAVAHIPAMVQACNEALAGFKDKLGRFKMDYAHTIGSLWVARCHARGFTLLGDPAVKMKLD